MFIPPTKKLRRMRPPVSAGNTEGGHKPNPFVAEVMKAMTRYNLAAAAKKFADDLVRNPAMPFADLERRVKELATSFEKAAAVPGKAKQQEDPKGYSYYARAYELRQKAGNWDAVWEDEKLGPKFLTKEARRLVCNAYTQRKRRKKG